MISSHNYSVINDGSMGMRWAAKTWRLFEVPYKSAKRYYEGNTHKQ